MEYYAIGDNQYFISHHGVMGMHWGVRRFQPYGAGGYNRKNGATGKEIGNAKKTSSSKTARIDQVEDFAKENNLLTGPYRGTKRQKEAADLGLEAMKRARLGDTYALDNMKESERESFREWFMVEDQTIGYGLIADQVNQGKTKHEIKSIIDAADKLTSSDESHAYDPGVFELFEYKMTSDMYIGDKFLDSCIAIRDQNKALKHGIIFIDMGDNMTNYSNNDFRYYKGSSYLAHYGKKGMKWKKHLKASSNWWDEKVTGSTARKETKEAQKGYSNWKDRASYQDSGKRTQAGQMREKYNEKNVDATRRYQKSLRGKLSKSWGSRKRKIGNKLFGGPRALKQKVRNTVVVPLTRKKYEKKPSYQPLKSRGTYINRDTSAHSSSKYSKQTFYLPRRRSS